MFLDMIHYFDNLVNSTLPILLFQNKQAGSTAPPFHPWCRGTTAPYYEDMVGVGQRFARDKDGKTYAVPSDMTYAEWKQKFVDNTAESGIINTELYRMNSNKDKFAHLEERMSKKHIRRLAKEYGIDLSGITLEIDSKPELLSLRFAGSANSEKIGCITFLPNAFINKEQLLRTIIHEREHVLQFKAFGADYVNQNILYFENLAYEAEDKFIEQLKGADRL